MSKQIPKKKNLKRKNLKFNWTNFKSIKGDTQIYQLIFGSFQEFEENYWIRSIVLPRLLKSKFLLNPTKETETKWIFTWFVRIDCIAPTNSLLTFGTIQRGIHRMVYLQTPPKINYARLAAHKKVPTIAATAAQAVQRFSGRNQNCMATNNSGWWNEKKFVNVVFVGMKTPSFPCSYTKRIATSKYSHTTFSHTPYTKSIQCESSARE